MEKRILRQKDSLLGLGAGFRKECGDSKKFFGLIILTVGATGIAFFAVSRSLFFGFRLRLLDL